MKLRTHIKKQRHILTTSGKLSFNRYILIPSDEESAKQLEALGLSKTIAPMDEMLQIANLPFNMTVAVMLDVAFEGATSSSYKEATERLRKKYFIQGSEDNDDIICTSRAQLQHSLQLGETSGMYFDCYVRMIRLYDLEMHPI